MGKKQLSTIRQREAVLGYDSRGCRILVYMHSTAPPPYPRVTLSLAEKKDNFDRPTLREKLPTTSGRLNGLSPHRLVVEGENVVQSACQLNFLALHLQPILEIVPFHAIVAQSARLWWITRKG